MLSVWRCWVRALYTHLGYRAVYRDRRGPEYLELFSYVVVISEILENICPIPKAISYDWKGLYRDYIVYWGYIGVMEQKMETTTVYFMTRSTLR